jgi:hypothetical protein
MQPSRLWPTPSRCRTAAVKDRLLHGYAQKKPIIGVMGSAQETLPEADRAHLAVVAESLGQAIVDQDCILITGKLPVC